MAKVTYHKSHSFIDNEGKEHNFQTQLYQIGVYGIANGNPALQGSFTPQKIRKMEKHLQKRLDAKEIKSFELGIPITVTDESGFWEEVDEKIEIIPSDYTEKIIIKTYGGDVETSAKFAFEKWGFKFYYTINLNSGKISITELKSGVKVTDGYDEQALKQAAIKILEKNGKIKTEKAISNWTN